MSHIEKSIEVDVPVRTAYNQWTQFEEFPTFMEGVKSVEQIDDRTLRWHAEIAGKDVDWTATITAQEPDQRIAWTSTGGASNSGSVTFQKLDSERCRITLRVEYDPTGVAENAAAGLGLVSARVSGDLERFKKFIEARGHETGAWRGEVHRGTVTPESTQRPQY